MDLVICVVLVSETKTNPDRETLGSVGFKSSKAGAGEHFLLLVRKATARAKGVFVHRRRYDLRPPGSEKTDAEK